MMQLLTRLQFLCILLPIISSANAWHKSNFTINSKNRNMLLLPTECGRANTYSPQFQLQSWGAWPWLGKIESYGMFQETCNAVLIHPQVALSSTLCVKHIPEEVLEETIFIIFSDRALPTYQNISITNINFLGETYNTGGSISLMRLSRPVIISPEIQPICLWEYNDNWSSQIANHNAMMVGTDHENIYKKDRLRIYQAPVRIVSVEKCFTSVDKIVRERILRTQLCFAYLRDPKDCHSFGSAMMMPRLAADGTIVWYLRAIQSQRTWYCNGPDYLPAFDLAKDKKWIESHFKSSVEAGCGRRVVAHTELITQGTEAIRGDWPWHVAIYRKATRGDGPNLYQCGGSLISQRFVLTAGHCVGREIKPKQFVVYLGKHNRDIFEAGQLEVQVSQIIPHEGMDWTTLRNDIALMKLEKDVAYTEYIQPICLWNEDDTRKESIFNHVGNVVGWGATENNTLSNKLMVANIPIANDLICMQSNANFYNKFLHEKTFCAGNPNIRDSGVCNGDSGGGLTLPITQGDHEITRFLRGIVSVSVKKAGANICDPQYYTIYTDIAKYTQWIAKNTEIVN